MSEDNIENLPSIEDYKDKSDELPSVEDLITEQELPSVEAFIEEDTPRPEEEIADNFNIVEEVEEEKIEEKNEQPKQNLTEVIRLINDVRESIPDIPEVKNYDEELRQYLSL